jgi:predicted MPP superfamily phosphohydrolase
VEGRFQARRSWGAPGLSILWLLVALAAVGALALAYGWFEAGWLRTRVVDVPVAGLPAALDGLRIAHLSDFHLGLPSRGALAVERAADWVRGRRPDLVLVTGDLLSHPRGRGLLERALEGLDAFAVLGNHDVGVTRDPFSRPAELESLPATVLIDESRTVAVRGATVQLAGVRPHSKAPAPPPDPGAALRILLSHYPRDWNEGYQLVLAGHMHAGQIVVPYPGGKLRFAHLGARLTEGIYRRGGVTLHVSPGLGTTFVPFRFFARPEVTELVLRSVA